MSTANLLEMFRDTAIKCHAGYKHEGPWEKCEWIECEDRRKMIDHYATTNRVWTDEFPLGGGDDEAPINEAVKGSLEFGNRAATRMRDLCVQKVKAMGQQWYAQAKKRGAAFSDKGRLAETIAAELESLTLDQVKER